MLADRASEIRHDIQELVRSQIDIFTLESSLTSSELFEYHTRAQKIKALYEELDRIGRDRVARVWAEAS
jgi:hypothetical protein